MRLVIVVLAIALGTQAVSASDIYQAQSADQRREIEARRALIERLRQLEAQLEVKRGLQVEAERRAELRTKAVELMRKFAARQAALQREQAQSIRSLDGRTLRIDKTVTVLFRNAEARDILEFLGRSADLIVQFAEGVNARVPLSVDFRDAQVAEVFNHVLEAAGLAVTIVDERTVLVTRRP